MFFCLYRYQDGHWKRLVCNLDGKRLGFTLLGCLGRLPAAILGRGGQDEQREQDVEDDQHDQVWQQRFDEL